LPMQPPQQMAASNQRWGIAKLGLLKWEDQQNHPLQQDFADMLGWRELTQKAEAVYDHLPTFSKAHTLMVCGNYGEAGALQYYGHSKDFKAHVMTGNGSFVLWVPQPLTFENIIFIDDSPPDNPLFQHFENVSVKDSIADPLSRQYGIKITLYQHADSTANRMAKESIKTMQAVFMR